MSPEILIIVEADAVRNAEGNRVTPAGWSRRHPSTGVAERSTFPKGFPRNLGGLPASSRKNHRVGTPEEKVQAEGTPSGA